MRILVVEDEHRLAAVLKQGLLEQGYAVDVAHDGEVGLGLAELEPYDLLVLDVMLPGLDGLALCRRLRAKGRHMPVLLLTARDAVDDRVTGLDSGADDYLTKPFSFVVLLARLRALLRRDSGPRPVVLEAAGIILDPASHRVHADDVEVSLSPREFLLLEHLLRAQPAVVSKEDLLDSVWGSTEDTNVVEVYVGYLRRKLGRKRIETVRGAGYRLAR